MEHFRLLLLQALALPAVPQPGNDALMLVAAFVSQVKVNGFVAFIIQKMKDSELPALGWISKNTPWVTRFVGLGAASLTAIGIHWTFTGSTLMVTGLSLPAIVTTLYKVAQNYLFQHAWWKVAFSKPAAAIPMGITRPPAMVQLGKSPDPAA
jgi:hypothetical protein